MKKLKSLRWVNDRIENCQCPKVFLSSARKVKPAVNQMIRKSGLKVVGYAGHQFDRGFTSVWLLSQSHLSLHSWPEYNFVTLSLEVCNFKMDDASKIDRLHGYLLEFFKPKRSRPKRHTIRLEIS